MIIWPVKDGPVPDILRQARVNVPGFPHHIVQRDHNRQPVFVERRDFEYYLANLQEWKQICELDLFRQGAL